MTQDYCRRLHCFGKLFIRDKADTFSPCDCRSLSVHSSRAESCLTGLLVHFYVLTEATVGEDHVLGFFSKVRLMLFLHTTRIR
jgi:hypothetical protein